MHVYSKIPHEKKREKKTRYNLAKKNERRYKSKCSVRDRGKEKRGRGVGEKGKKRERGV